MILVRHQDGVGRLDHDQVLNTNCGRTRCCVQQIVLRIKGEHVPMHRIARSIMPETSHRPPRRRCPTNPHPMAPQGIRLPRVTGGSITA